MKCAHCGGRLSGTLTVCPFCGTRQERDLQQVNHRDLGPADEMACPRCESALEVRRIAFGKQSVEVERCPNCRGVFFNPGEVECFLEQVVSGAVWLDFDLMSELEATAAAQNRIARLDAGAYRKYLRCPDCRETMAPSNFGGKSGVLVDRCRQHGVWLDGGELRLISEWWHAGGKHIHQARETERAHRVSAPTASRPVRRSSPPTAADHGPTAGSIIGELFYHLIT